MDSHQELPEADEPLFVRVEVGEQVITIQLGVVLRKEELEHVDELGRRELAIWKVLHEALVPLPDLLLVEAGVGLKELQVLGPQPLLPRWHAAHHFAELGAIKIFFLKMISDL